jgi:hypothetical protein
MAIHAWQRIPGTSAEMGPRAHPAAVRLPVDGSRRIEMRDRWFAGTDPDDGLTHF